MPFLTAVDPGTATGESRALFDTIERRLTRVPNMIRVMALRLVGFGDEEIVEIIAAVALNLFRNYFNLIVKTDVDFPLVRTGHPAALDTTA